MALLSIKQTWLPSGMSVDRVFGAVILGLWLITSVIVSAEDSKAEALVLDKLRAARGDFTYVLLGDAGIPGYKRVAVENGPTLYVAADGSHFFDGTAYAIAPGGFVDIADQLLVEVRKQAFAGRESADMIVFPAKGVTRAKINIFTDIDCGYCRKLHNEVDQLNAYGIEVRYLAYPRAGLESLSYQKIVTAWCATNPQDTLTRLKQGETLPMETCEPNPVAEHFTLGLELGVTGTPAVIMMDGTLVPGYQPASAFAEMLGLL